MTRLEWRDDAPAEQIRELVETATRHDGTAPVGEHVVRELTGGRTRHLVAVDGADVVGYLNLTPGETPVAELVVEPSRRRNGIGGALATAALDAGGPATRLWAHGNLEPARATAAELGLTAVRELLQMRRPLSELPDVPTAEDARVRTYGGPEDDAELLRVNNAAFDWHPEQGGWTTDDIDDRKREQWFDPAGLFLAFDTRGDAKGVELLGFHWTKVHHDQPGFGEVYVLGIDPRAQGRGLGRMLTLVGLHHLRDVGMTDVLLYTEAGNTAAVHTYERLGFTVHSVDAAYARR